MDDSDHLIKGVILNRTSAHFYETIAPVIEEEVKIKPLGYLPKLKDMQWQSRHLGLLMPEEIAGLQEQMDLLSDVIRKSVALEEILTLTRADANKLCAVKKSRILKKKQPHLRLAVAYDEAFCFYYPQNLKWFEENQIEIIKFSPIHDVHLPECDGLLLGGGYPELYAAQLAQNESMRSEIRQALERHLPSLAECGGFLYLNESLEGEDGIDYPMVGMIHGKAYRTDHLCRFGYVEISSHVPDKSFGTIRGHEFHYYDSTENGCNATATKPASGKHWECMHIGADHVWGFAHLYYPSASEGMDWFIKQMENYHEQFL